MKKVVALLPVEDFWRPLLAIMCCLAVVAGLLTFRLGSLTPGLSEAEHRQRSSAASLGAIIDNPLHVYHKLGQFALQKSGHNGPAAMRLPSILVGFVATVAMFIILKNWYTVRVAVLGALLFATSSWFLHSTRLGLPDSSFVLPLLLLVSGTWLHRGKFITFAVLLALLTGLVMLYVPGMVWFVLPIAIWQRKTLKRAFRHLNLSQQTAAILVALLGLAPLIWSFVFQPALMVPWLGLPAEWPRILAYFQNIAEVPLEIFVRGSGDATYDLGRLPLLDAFSGFMVVMGSFVSLFHIRQDRTKLMLGAIIAATLLIALDGPFKITFLLPIMYLLAAGGIALLLQQWFTVFPRNPVARTLGVVIVSTAVLVTSYYHLSRYFIAWPNVPATKSTFNRQP